MQLDPKFARIVALYGGLGFQIFGAVIAGTVVGYFLDKHLQTEPVFSLLGILCGSIAAMVVLIRTVKQLGKDEQ